MNGFTFYHEFKNKRRNISDGNCLAVIRANRCPDNSLECIGPVYFHPNSACAGTAVSLEYLRSKCKRISEAKARQIHPMLFERLEVQS